MTLVRRAVATFTWRHWAIATICGLGAGALSAFESFDTEAPWLLGSMLITMAHFVVAAWVFMAAMVFVDASVPANRTPSFSRYTAGAAVATAIYMALVLAAAPIVPKAPRATLEGREITSRKPSPAVRRFLILRGRGVQGTLHATLGMFIFIGLRNARRAEEALAAAELERVEANRRLLASRTAAMQAEIDPDGLIEALHEIERCYEREPARASQHLDALIVGLREAIPRLRHASEPAEA
jgi:uncharacterized membrane protein